MNARLVAWVSIVAAGAIGCGGGTGSKDVPAPTAVSVRVDPASATTVALLGGPTLHFDAGAVANATTVTIQVSAATIPADYGLQGRAYDLGPSGLVLAAGKVKATLPLAAASGTIWISSSNGYDALPVGTIAGGAITSDLPHFSTVFAGLTCAAGAACTPANPCHTGATTCSGPPACVDQAVNVGDGTACCSANAGTCQGGSCVTSSFDGTWLFTNLRCNGVLPGPPISNWFVPPSTLTIVQHGTAGHSVWSNGTCAIDQLHDVLGTYACTPSAAACLSYSTSIFGGQACGQTYDDRNDTTVVSPPYPACRGGAVSGSSTSGPCPVGQTMTFTLIRQ